ncbi:adenylyltransferase/cytidyltransferase family protein [Candidatus Pelagibacter sp.]|nr:adenylyltransferase/cytidyltransferase family protein [Candidatus Pelagibacter sp.]
MKNKRFNWKKKSAIYIGRFQPFHEGHKILFIDAFKKNSQVVILVMDSYNINNKNPFKFNYVKKKINENLKKYKGSYIIIKIPVVAEVIYGRKVGYKFRKVKVSKSTEKISATKIRKNIFKIS